MGGGPTLAPPQAHARSLALAVAASPALAASLNASAAAVATAYAAAWDAAATAAAAAAAAPPAWALAFTHACRHYGCREPGCALCAANPRRACATTLAPKCLAGDALRAACGADVRVELVPLGGDAGLLPPPPDLAVELSVVDGRAYDALLASGRGGDAACAAACAVAHNKGGAPLLAGARGARRGAAGGLLVPASAPGTFPLVDVSVTGSSESLLSGQKPPFRLLARAVAAVGGAQLRGCAIAVSDPFVAATPRVRSAVKADVPVVTDHVSKLVCVGPQTQAKLADIPAAAAAAGVALPPLPHATVTTVGQFRDVAAAAAGDPDACDALKKVLKLTKGWDAAAEHAAAAVSLDGRARLWAGGAGDALAYCAELGAVDPTAPAGVVCAAPTGARLDPFDRLPPARRAAAAASAAATAAAWFEAGHPGWRVWEGVESAAVAPAAAAGGGPLPPLPPPGKRRATAKTTTTPSGKRAVPASPFEVGGTAPTRAAPRVRAAPGDPHHPPSVDGAALQARLSSVVGRALTGADMARLVPSFPFVSAGDDVFDGTGLTALEFTPSELARMEAWERERAAAGGDALGPPASSEALLRFLADRLAAAPGSGGVGAAVGESVPSGLEAQLNSTLSAFGASIGGSASGLPAALSGVPSLKPPTGARRTKRRGGE